MRRIMAVVLLGLSATGCPSIPEPVSDDTPPVVAMTIEYRTPTGVYQSEIIRATDSPRTISVHGGQRISILFSISDNEGAKTVGLVPEMFRSTGTGTQTTLMQGESVTSSRPVAFLSKVQTFDSLGDWTLRVFAQGENWLGLHGQTPQITFRPQ